MATPSHVHGGRRLEPFSLSRAQAQKQQPLSTPQLLLGSNKGGLCGVRISVLISAVTLVCCAGLATLVISRQAPPKRVEPTTVAGLLRAYECRSSETKKIIVRGIEDNYSPNGVEPNFVRPDRQTVENNSLYTGGSYDQIQTNRQFTDSLQVPSHIISGIFVIRLKPIDGDNTDSITIGDIVTATSSNPNVRRFGSTIAALTELAGWAKTEDIFYTDFDNIKFAISSGDRSADENYTLLDFVREDRKSVV